MASVANDDPLLSWLRSIRQVKQAHAEDKTKIFPYVSDCYKEFCNNMRYRDDPRFLRVCVQLADCSPDPLKIMAELDERAIGHTHALFYEAYATCLEAKRRFGDANNVYKRGLASQAQPMEKLINSYTNFRERMDTRKKRKQDQLEQHGRKICNIAEEGLPRHTDLGDNKIRHMEACQGGTDLASRSHLLAKNLYTAEGSDISFEELRLASASKNISSNREQNEANMGLAVKPVSSQSICKLESGSFGEETIQIRNFAAEVITGKEKDMEDARHHGLVDPTINTKEALQDILSMFRKPLNFGKDLGKPSKRLVSVNVSASLPLHDDNRQLASPKCGKPIQPLEFSVFKDEEESEPQIGRKRAAGNTSVNDENKTARSSCGSLQEQSLELCVYKDDEGGGGLPPPKAAAGVSHFDQRGKRLSNPLLGGLQARPLEFSVFKDDEQGEEQLESGNKLAEKGKNTSVVAAHSDRTGSKPPWLPRSEEESCNSGFFVFKDEEASEQEENNAFKKYRDTKNLENGKAQGSKFTNSKQANAAFLVFKDDPTESSLVERKVGLSRLDGEADVSKKKGNGANKKLACGIENLLPQSPLYQP